jgi:hypothetical protein
MIDSLLISLWLLPQEIATTDRVRWGLAADQARWWRFQGQDPVLPLLEWRPDAGAADRREDQGDHEGSKERQTAASLDGVTESGHIRAMRADRSDGVAPSMEMRVLLRPRVMINYAITRVDEELEQRMWVRVLGAGAQLHREQEQPEQSQRVHDPGEPRETTR